MHLIDTLPSADAELYRRLEEVCHYVWDPIGVSSLPTARGEYSGYMVGIFGRAKTRDVESIVEFFRWVEEDRMGLAFDAEKARRAAEVMVAWVDHLASGESR